MPSSTVKTHTPDCSLNSDKTDSTLDGIKFNKQNI